MSGNEIGILWILIGNICVVAGFFAWSRFYKKEKKLSVCLKCIVMLLCPLGGAMFFLMGFLCYKIFLDEDVDLEDVIFSKERVKTYLHPDEEMERNMVSLEEALAVTDKGNLRNLMLNVVKGDYKNSLASIALALNSEDTETAHYAASVLQEVLNDFRGKVQKRYKDLLAQEDANRKCEIAIELTEYMNQVLEQHVLTGLEQASMVAILGEVCEILYETDREKISSACYEIVCMRLLEIKEYENCKIWCLRAKEQYPSTLATYTCQLKLYFSCQDKENFFRVMEELKESNVVIDNETLEMIRVFL